MTLVERSFHALPAVFADAIAIRTIETKLLELFRQGVLNGTVHTCVGQELIGPIVCRWLRDDDYVLSTHRGHGHFYARTRDMRALFGELMGKTCGASGGIGGSQHLVHRNYLSNGIQGGMAPIAAGLAEAAQRRGSGGVVVAFIGDGTLGEGALYEALNICGVRRLPVVFVLEHNQYAQSTHTSETFAGSLEHRIEGFGLRCTRGSIWDPLLLDEQCGAAIEGARARNEPHVLVADCYRLNAHSKGDDNRARAELERYRALDPLNALVELGLPEVAELQARAVDEVERTVDELRGADDLRSISNDVPAPRSAEMLPAGAASERRVNELLNEILRARLETCAEAILVGEDIADRSVGTEADYGGAFKVTRGLSTAFPGRVINFPISEAALIGFGTGLALAGFRPVVEIMFGDFMTLTFDQIVQHATKFRRMFADRVRVPLVIRTPMGGKRGYGPTHSQSLEKFFLGIPDLAVVALNAAVPPERVYESVFAREDPTLVIENKVLYTLPLRPRPMTDEPFPTARVSMAELVPAVTIVCYGEMLEAVSEAVRRVFIEDEIVCEILAPTCLHPLNVAPISESVARSRRLLVVEEGATIAGFGSEVLSQLAETGVRIDAFQRLGNNTIVPSSLAAELELLPNVRSIGNAIRACARGRS